MLGGGAMGQGKMPPPSTGVSSGVMCGAKMMYIQAPRLLGLEGNY